MFLLASPRAGALFVLGALIATAAIADVDPVDAIAARLGFSAGARPVVAEPANRGSLSARACASCHNDVFADWETTRHRAAWDNPTFQDGLAREPLPRCVHCHAPLAQQAAEVGALRGQGGRAAPRRAEPLETSLLHEGVTCAVCHVRAGKVLVTRAVRPSDPFVPMHPIAVEPALTDPAFCAACHEFGFSDSTSLMQGTYSEWRAYAAAGGEGTCQSCHMPGGRHLFRGAWDETTLRASVSVDVEGEGLGRALVVRSRGVGHHAPTGDLFRHFTVEARLADGDFAEVARLGRRWGGEGRDKHVIEDTALRPGVPRRVPLPAGSVAWRVRYHFGEERHERAGAAPPVVVVAGVLP